MKSALRNFGIGLIIFGVTLITCSVFNYYRNKGIDEMIEGIPATVQELPKGQPSGWYCGQRTCGIPPQVYLVITSDTLTAEKDAQIHPGDYRSGWLTLTSVNDSMVVSERGDGYEYHGNRFVVLFKDSKPVSAFILEFYRHWEGWIVPGSGATTNSLNQNTFKVPFETGETFLTYPGFGSERVETPENFYKILEAGDDAQFVKNLQNQKF